MARCQLSLDRTSFTSLEDDHLFSAQSSKSTSISTNCSTSQEQEQMLLAKGIITVPRPAEPPASSHDAWAETTPASSLNEKHSNPGIDLHGCSHQIGPVCPSATLGRLDKHSAPGSSAQLETDTHNGGTSGISSNNAADELVSSPATADTTRQWSSITGDQCSATACRCQCHLPIIAGAQPDGYISKQTIDGILCHVHAYLSGRRPSTCSDRVATAVTHDQAIPPSMTQPLPDNAQPERPAESPNQYLISSDDITGILDIVIAGIRNGKDDSTQSECRSLLLPSDTQAKPILRTENIVPSMSAVADPATTICSPRPHFSSTSFMDDPGSPRSTAKATYISRRSITEINWGSFPDSLQRDDANVRETELHIPRVDALRHREFPWLLPLYGSQSHRISWPQPHRVAQRMNPNIIPHHGPPDNFENQFRRPSSQRATSEPFDQYPPMDQCKHVNSTIPITSFPRLTSRSCTDDWLTPLGLFDDIQNTELPQVRKIAVNLYNEGVDAHSGAYVYSTLPILEEDPQATPPLPTQSHQLFQQCNPHMQYDHDQRVPGADQGINHYGNHLGHSIGVASHQRTETRESHDESRGLRGDLLDNLRRHSFMTLSDQKSDCTRRNRSAQPSRMGIPMGRDGMRGRSSQDLLRNILDRSDSSLVQSSRSKSDAWASYGSGRRESSGLARAPCSEDTTPHVCADEQESLLAFR
ncbi:hypothetical protein F4861DRAFT_399217 [Xylaria intraflava]|nr:hypothetical protein F4861DRAFT_399217 [Xylaria intraflava]